MKWAATGDPTFVVRGVFKQEFLHAMHCMNEAAVEADYTIPPGPDAFMMYNDRDDTNSLDVLAVMNRAAELAELEGK